MKKYLITIEASESPRIYNFYQQTCFNTHQTSFCQFGVVGKDLSVDAYFKLAVAEQFIPLSPGELGCTMSHLAALRNFLQSDDDYAIIFEDDVIAPENLDLDELEQCIRSMELQNCFFLSLGGIEQLVNNRVYGQFETQKILGKTVLKIHSASLDRVSGAYAYCVDRAMAQTLINYHQVLHVYDHWGELYALNRSIQFYAVHIFDHPDISAQKEQLSHIEVERQQLNRRRKLTKTFFIRLKYFIIKRWLKYFQKSYS